MVIAMRNGCTPVLMNPIAAMATSHATPTEMSAHSRARRTTAPMIANASAMNGGDASGGTNRSASVSAETTEEGYTVAVPVLGKNVGGATTAGGTSCDVQQENAVHVGPELPANPTGIRRIGVEANQIDCSSLQTVPLIQCTTDGETR